MSEFIVLGIIPGTQVQITFLLWIIIVSGVGVLTVAWLVKRTRLVSRFAITLSIFVLTRRRLQA